MKARSRLFPVAPEGSALRRCDPLRGHGALVAVGDLPGTGGDELAEELGAEIHKLDVTSEVDWDGVIRAVLSRHRTIDVLVTRVRHFRADLHLGFQSRQALSRALSKFV